MGFFCTHWLVDSVFFLLKKFLFLFTMSRVGDFHTHSQFMSTTYFRSVNRAITIVKQKNQSYSFYETTSSVKCYAFGVVLMH